MKNHHYGWFFVIFFVNPRVGKWGARQWRVIVPMGAWGVRVAGRELAENRVFGSKSDNCPKFAIFVNLQILPFCGVAGWSICRQRWCKCAAARAMALVTIYIIMCMALSICFMQFLIVSDKNRQIASILCELVVICYSYCDLSCNFETVWRYLFPNYTSYVAILLKLI